MTVAAAPAAPASGAALAPRSRAAWPRVAFAIALTGLATLAIVAAVELWRLCGADHRLPLWDPAEHGVAGVTLAHALLHRDLPGFLAGINRQVLWPFSHALMLTPWAIALGMDYATAERLSAVLLVGFVLALCAAGRELHPTRGAWIGAAAAVLALLAPIVRVFGSLTMLEMPGAFLLALALWLHLRATREGSSRRAQIAAGLATAALFFCKYNYGLLWLAAVAVDAWLALPAERRTALRVRAAAWLAPRSWLRPFPAVMAVYALAIVAIAVTGGRVFTIGGRTISVRSAGNPVYGFCVLVLAWAFVRAQRAGGVRAVMARRTQRQRIWIATVALPIAAWFLIPTPNRFGPFFAFVANRDSGLPLLSPATWLDGPRALAHDYAPAPWLGWLVLALALIPPFGARAGRDPRRLVHLAMWIGLLATALHRYHQPRFLFTVAPLVWLAAATTAVAWLERALAGLPKLAREAAFAAALAALLAWAALGAPPAAATALARRSLSSPPELAAVVDRVLELAAYGGKRAWLLGYSNVLSPALLRWQRLAARIDLAERRLPEHAPAVDPAPDAEAIAARIEAMRTSERPIILALALRPLAGDGEYRWETRADSLTAARLDADPRVAKAADDTLLAASFRVALYRFKEAPTTAMRVH